MERVFASITCLLLSIASYSCAGAPRSISEAKPEKWQAVGHSQPGVPNPSPSASPTPEDPKVVKRRKQIEKDMLGGNYHHDGAIELMEIGNVSSVPALLAVLKKNPPMKFGDRLSFVCTTSHALSALRKITGHDAGNTFEDWSAWWEQYQKEKNVGAKRAA